MLGMKIGIYPTFFQNLRFYRNNRYPGKARPRALKEAILFIKPLYFLVFIFPWIFKNTVKILVDMFKKQNNINTITYRKQI